MGSKSSKPQSDFNIFEDLLTDRSTESEAEDDIPETKESLDAESTLLLNFKNLSLTKTNEPEANEQNISNTIIGDEPIVHPELESPLPFRLKNLSLLPIDEITYEIEEKRSLFESKEKKLPLGIYRQQKPFISSSHADDADAVCLESEEKNNTPKSGEETLNSNMPNVSYSRSRRNYHIK